MKKVLLLLVLSFSFSFIFAQKNVIDKIVAIVGDEIILQSDIENAFLQQQGQGIISSSPDYKAEILEQQLVQKLLMAQAQIDSIIVSDEEVENAVSSQIEFFISNIGSQERLEKYFGKSIQEIKDDMRNPLKEQLITEQMQQKIVEKIRITPSEVKLFQKDPQRQPSGYARPLRITTDRFKTDVSEAEKERIREQLRSFRDQILKGKRRSIL
ncbi:MAG: SurA N-terminal domain-containing protein [Odoribacter splanchnicus]